MAYSNNRTRKKKTKKSLIIFTVELIVLLVLVAAIFAYARINAGLRSIGSQTLQQTQTGTAQGGGGGAVNTLAVSGETAEDLVETPVGAGAYVRDPNADADAAEENEEVTLNSNLKGYTNIALVGIDTRDSAQIDYANSDTMLIASINNETGKVRMVSLYRDTLLNIGTKDTVEVPQGDADDEDVDIVGDEFVTYEDDNDGGDDDAVGDDDGGYDYYDEFDGDDDYDPIDDGDDDGYDGGYDDYNDEDDNGGGSYDGDDDDSGNGNSGDSSGGSSGGNSSYGGGNDYDDYDSYDDGGNSSDEGSAESEVYYANNNEFDVTTVSEENNAYTGVTTAAGRYDKANAAYSNGSAKQLLSMLNKNLDLNIHDYVVVDFNAVAMLVDDIDGIDVWMTKQEIIHMNNYCVETSKVTGLDYEPIEPDEMPRDYHLNGVQAVSYARIRYTTGNDMKRTQRQRVVIQKIVNKAKTRGLQFIQGMITDVFPLCKTSLSSAEIIKLASQIFSYEIEKTTGFPFEHIEKDVYVGSKKLDAVVPVTLETNVQELHEFLFDDEDYQVSATVLEYSRDIESLSNLTEKSREAAIQNSIIGESGGEADVVK